MHPATLTCAKWSANGVSPDIEQDYCQFSASNLTFEIYSDTTGDYCFYYEGYIGLPGIYSIGYVESWHGAYGWLLYYEPPYSPGTGITFNFGSDKYYANPPFTGTSPSQKITQVDVVGWDCTFFC